MPFRPPSTHAPPAGRPRLGARASRGAHPRRRRAPARRAGHARPGSSTEWTGDYDEDEWGFDEGFVELVEPFFASFTNVVAGAGRGRRARACPRPRTPDRQPRGRPWGGRRPREPDGVLASTRSRATRASSCSTGLSTCRGSRAACGRFGGVVASPFSTRCGCFEQDHLVAVFPEGVRAPERRTPSATGSSASVAAGSWSSRCARARRSCRWRAWGERRSIRSSASCPRSPASSGAHLPRHARVPLVGPAGARAAAVQVADRVLPVDRDRRSTAPRGRRGPRRWCSSSPSGSARRSSRRCTPSP